MSDQDGGFVPALRQVSIAQVTRPSILVILLCALLVASASSEPERAAATVAFVLAEALALYVGYGALMRIASPTARELLERAVRSDDDVSPQRRRIRIELDAEPVGRHPRIVLSPSTIVSVQFLNKAG